ncbi:MAG: NADH-quinone oxidoreductase subunit J [Phycisphaerales bacterium]|nr:NADH-quinone oxidoreductase subunit J [Phycisphaerales bacterium]
MTGGLVYLLYVLFAVGGIALYLAMPRTQGAHAKAGLVIGGGAVAGLLALCAQVYMAPHGSNIFYYIFAGVALLAAGRVVTHPNPTYSAVYFALVVLSVAVLLVMQRAEFLAVALVIIYAGAILVTYAFVIMLAQQSGGGSSADQRAREPMLAIIASFVVMGTIAGRVSDLRELPNSPVEVQATADVMDVPLADTPVKDAGNTLSVGRTMFNQYVVVVQLAGLLLLVAMVGAIAVSRKRIPADEHGPPPPPPGEIGRTVPPF